jgi:large subunit ribosomal protein L9
MKVILNKTVATLGQAGEIKEVADGHARNFLIPQGLAKPATEQAITDMEKRKNKKVKSVANLGKKNKDVAKKLNNLKISIKAKADDKKTLFAAVNAKKIVEELKERGYNVDAKFVKLDEPIKSLGYYDIMIDFGDEITAKLGLTITRED